VLAAMLEHLIRCTHAENKVIFDRDGFRVRERLIHRDDVGIDEKQIGDGNLVLRVRTTATAEQYDRKKYQGSYLFHEPDTTRLRTQRPFCARIDQQKNNNNKDLAVSLGVRCPFLLN
jgi:hypothetical protein